MSQLQKGWYILNTTPKRLPDLTKHFDSVDLNVGSIEDWDEFEKDYISHCQNGNSLNLSTLTTNQCNPYNDQNRSNHNLWTYTFAQSNRGEDDRK